MLLSADEAVIADRLMKLKDEAGSHSPSLLTLREQIPELEIAVDACFISNPYATQLFLDHLQREVIRPGQSATCWSLPLAEPRDRAPARPPASTSSPESIFVGNGAIEIIQAMIHRFTRRSPGQPADVLPYYEFARPHEVVFNVLRKEDDFHFDPAQYLELVAESDPDLSC